MRVKLNLAEVVATFKRERERERLKSCLDK